MLENRVFVGGLPFNAEESKLCEFLAFYGPVVSAKIVRDSNGLSRGYGFVTYEDNESAMRLIDQGYAFFNEKRLNFGKAIIKRKGNFNLVRNNFYSAFGTGDYDSHPASNNVQSNNDDLIDKIDENCPEEGGQLADKKSAFCANDEGNSPVELVERFKNVKISMDHSGIEGETKNLPTTSCNTSDRMTICQTNSIYSNKPRSDNFDHFDQMNNEYYQPPYNYHPGSSNPKFVQFPYFMPMDTIFPDQNYFSVPTNNYFDTQRIAPFNSPISFSRNGGTVDLNRNESPFEYKKNNNSNTHTIDKNTINDINNCDKLIDSSGNLENTQTTSDYDVVDDSMMNSYYSTNKYANADSENNYANINPENNENNYAYINSENNGNNYANINLINDERIGTLGRFPPSEHIMNQNGYFQMNNPVNTSKSTNFANIHPPGYNYTNFTSKMNNPNLETYPITDHDYYCSDKLTMPPNYDNCQNMFAINNNYRNIHTTNDNLHNILPPNPNFALPPYIPFFTPICMEILDEIDSSQSSHSISNNTESNVDNNVDYTIGNLIESDSPSTSLGKQNESQITSSNDSRSKKTSDNPVIRLDEISNQGNSSQLTKNRRLTKIVMFTPLYFDASPMNKQPNSSDSISQNAPIIPSDSIPVSTQTTLPTSARVPVINAYNVPSPPPSPSTYIPFITINSDRQIPSNNFPGRVDLPPQ